MSGTSSFASHALDGVPEPDFADVQIVALRGATGVAADDWVRGIFDARSLPLWVKALFGLRAVLVPFIGLNQSRERAASPFEVRDVADGEALVVTDAPHLLFRLGVAVDDDAGCSAPPRWWCTTTGEDGSTSCPSVCCTDQSCAR